MLVNSDKDVSISDGQESQARQATWSQLATLPKEHLTQGVRKDVPSMRYGTVSKFAPLSKKVRRRLFESMSAPRVGQLEAGTTGVSGAYDRVSSPTLA